MLLFMSRQRIRDHMEEVIESALSELRYSERTISIQEIGSGQRRLADFAVVLRGRLVGRKCHLLPSRGFIELQKFFLLR